MKKTGIGAVLVAALALAGCSTPAPAPESEGSTELTTVRIGYIPGAHDVAQLFIAEEAGYFAEEGIDLEVTAFQTGISLSQALTGGSLDVGVMGAVIANFPAKGQGKLFLLNNQQVDIHQIWAAPGSGIESVEDLRGKTIATTTGTAADLVLQVALDEAAPGGTVAWWIGFALAALGVAGIGYAGCPIYWGNVEVAHWQKSVAIRAGLVLFLVGSVTLVVAMLAG